MFTYTDAQNHSWLVAVTLRDVRRIRAHQQLDLITASDAEFDRLLDTETALDILWLLCAEQAQAQGLTADDWAEGLTGAILPAALCALWEALGDFFQHSPTLLCRWIDRMNQTTPDTNPETRETSGTESTGWPASSAATGGT